MKKKEIFNSIIGYDNTKKTLERIIDILNNQDKYKKLGSKIPHGLLLYGPPGTGKTCLANEMVRNLNRKSYIVRKTKSNGSFVKYLKEVFSKAKNNEPAVIVLDDLDKFTSNSNNNEEFVTVQSLIDEVKDMNIFVIATVNDKWLLPNSLVRSGRFDIQIRHDEPTEKDSLKIIDYYIKKKNIDESVDIKKISYILIGSSCADIEKVCNQAGLYAGFENKEKIGMKELIKASLELKYNTNIEEFDKEYDYILETSYHEAGHALIGELLEPGSVSFATVVDTSSDTKGFTTFHINDNYFSDIKFMENRIKTLLAGKAATEVVYNKCDTGANSDLSRAFDISARLVDNYCMEGFDAWIRGLSETPEVTKNIKNDKMCKLITKYYNEVKELLIKNREILDVLARELKNKKILFQEEIDDICKNNSQSR